ncbi:DUF3859 domain-containing protein [Neptunicella marina]|uniref:DUF3859 domain-containing protein n=1 Tax=Neptunicella marina TaxID=2125989 RepID=A0A8J6IV39_9ALTE|nr:DUF3859 domain-containing protein [Neptunicella marina]MBC3766919.1 DUF3859 domain-containing protein [Neptunicella marina]
MAKAKIQIEILSYGIHSQWDANSKALPRVQQFTTDIPARVDIEFGFIVNIKKAKGKKLRYCIYHPGILDKKGREMAPFDGEEYVRSNDWDFYLGDTIWLPLEDKLGPWHMTIEIDNQIVAEKLFDVVPETPQESLYWAKR